MSKEADERMPLATARADRQAHKDEVARLREQIATLERDLRRARRCLASERAGRESLRVRLADEERANAFGVGVLCRLAFPGDAKDEWVGIDPHSRTEAAACVACNSAHLQNSERESLTGYPVVSIVLSPRHERVQRTKKGNDNALRNPSRNLPRRRH